MRDDVCVLLVLCGCCLICRDLWFCLCELLVCVLCVNDVFLC